MVCRSVICATISEISPIAATAAPVSAWIACTRRAMSSVAFAVSCASSFTSLATTAKPLPASPARAASMVAFSASRLVCSAMQVITFTTLPISAEDSPSFVTVALVVSTAVTAFAATSDAAAAFDAISRMLAPISSAPAATVWTFRLTSSAAPATTPDCAEVSSADAEICADDADSSSELAATASADATTATIAPQLADRRVERRPIRPSSSACVTPPVARSGHPRPSRPDRLHVAGPSGRMIEPGDRYTASGQRRRHGAEDDRDPRPAGSRSSACCVGRRRWPRAARFSTDDRTTVVAW